MSFAVRRIDSTAPGSSGDAPPTSATVLDYICLFTHDLKRKQKRWQDGKLKYHTFNRRIMVYDDRGNFIGDGHWHAGGHLEEGEELQLDRGAAMVQVADCVGSREQDLTEILDKRVREVAKRRAIAAAKTPASSRVAPVPAQPWQEPQSARAPTSHRSLSSIVASPGPTGRAVISAQSPYEVRRADCKGPTPPAKKRRMSPSPPSKAGFARSLFGARLNLSARSLAPSSVGSRAMKERTGRSAELTQAVAREVDDDDVVVVKDVLLHQPSTKKSRPTQHTGVARNGEALIVPHEIRDRSVGSILPHSEKRRQPISTQNATNISQTNVVTIHEDSTPESRLLSRQVSATKENVVQTARETSEKVPRPSQQTYEGTGKQRKQTTPPAPRPAGPRTELRIKSRRRRGLLVAAEQEQANTRATAVVTSTLSLHNAKIDGTPTPEPNPYVEILEADVQQIFEHAAGATKISTPLVEHDCVESEDLGCGRSTMNEGAREEEPGCRALISSSIHAVLESDDAMQPASKSVEEPHAISSSSQPRELGSDSSHDESSHGARTEPLDKIEVVAESSEDSDDMPSKRRRRLADPRRVRRVPHGINQDSDASSEELPSTRPRTISTTMQYDSSFVVESSENEIPERPPNQGWNTRVSRASNEEIAAVWSSQDESEKRPPKRAKRTKAKTNPQVPAAKAPPGPRLSRLARKGVKSKEILGWVPRHGVDIFKPAPFAMAGNHVDIPIIGHSSVPDPEIIERTSMETLVAAEPSASSPFRVRAPDTGGISHERGLTSEEPAAPLAASSHTSKTKESAPTVTEEREKASELGHIRSRSPPHCDDGTFQPGPKPTKAVDVLEPKIVNPATRGKKAARREDAAGQAPQNIVPFDAPQIVRRLSKANSAGTPNAGAHLPGFSKANGGAWSKHAEDLLGMTRPSGQSTSRNSIHG